MNWNDTDVEAYLVSRLGPPRMPLRWLVRVTTIYSVIFLTGLVGNVCTCVVISRNQYMQTPTNCYLFNLAIADMLTLLLAMPPELYAFWHQYPWQLGRVGCWLRGLIPEATAYASILTIVTFSSERYVAICRPLQHRRQRHLGAAVRNIALIWVAALLCALPFAFLTKVNYLRAPWGDILEQSAWCGFPFNQPHWSWQVLMLCSTLLFFVLPMTLITVLYVRIALALHRSHKALLLGPRAPEEEAAQTERERSKARSRVNVVRMLAAVVVGFFVCWAPFHAQRLLFLYVALYGEWTDRLKHVNEVLFMLAGCFYYFNSTINPILYSVMSNRFRVAFREKLCAGPPSIWCLCCCCFCCQRRRNHYFDAPPPYDPTRRRPSLSHSSVRLSGFRGPPSPQPSTADHHFLTPPPSDVSCRLRVSAATAEEVAEELDAALRPEIERLEDSDARRLNSECVSCTNCGGLLLLPVTKHRSSEGVDRTSTTDLSSGEVRESLV